MKYYLIAGEASGDLHASNLMKALLKEDTLAEFRFFGGDLMSAVGGTCVKHYKELAYMGFVPVLLHLNVILRNMQMCCTDIVHWNPDVVILVDYPGFNLKIAKFCRKNTCIPVFYYISPKIWAWKEYRMKNIRRDVDELFSILPFEIPFFEEKHHYPIHYVGNPCVDAVMAFKEHSSENFDSFIKSNLLNDKPIIALLAGSRKQEIKDNLPDMLAATKSLADRYQRIIAGAPGIDESYYRRYIGSSSVTILFGETYRLLQQAECALVTSGTATLETALFKVPQVVCYHTPVGKFISFLRRHVLKVRFISLVNLIVNREIVCELVADTMTVNNIYNELGKILKEGDCREKMLRGYDEMAGILGPAGASKRAAREMVRLLNNKKVPKSSDNIKFEIKK